MLHIKRLSLMTGLFAMLMLAVGSSSALAGKMGQQVAKQAKSGKTEMVNVIVTYEDKPGKAEKQRIKEIGGKIKHAYGKLKMRSLSVPAHKLEKLAKGKGVRHVSIDGVVEGFTQPARLTANQPIAPSANKGYTGKGVTVAVIDSGLSNHADLDKAGKQIF